MRANVFTDAALGRYAGRFVWLAIDTERAANAGFLKKYPINVWPTLLVVDPVKEQVALRYAGGATVPQLEKLLKDGERAVRGTAGRADAALLRGDQLANEKKNAEAAAAYREAVDHAPKGWSRLGRAAESLTFALYVSRDYQTCAATALGLYARLRGTTSSLNVASNGLACASQLPEHGAPFEALEKACREVLDNPNLPVSADDRSGLYETLIGAREAVKDESRPEEAGRGVGRVPRGRGEGGDDARAAGRLRLASAHGIPRPRAAGARRPDAGAVGARLPGRLQPAGAARPRLPLGRKV